jgi:hypothetical protein
MPALHSLGDEELNACSRRKSELDVRCWMFILVAILNLPSSIFALPCRAEAKRRRVLNLAKKSSTPRGIENTKTGEPTAFRSSLMVFFLGGRFG